MCLCVHTHASKCPFWITFSHFPLNFISSVSDKWDCRLTTLFPMPGESEAIVLASDGSRAAVDWQHHWFPCASCPDPDGAHSSLLCSYHACHRARREEKEGKARGVLRARRWFFLYALLLDQKPISSLSRWPKKLCICLSMCIICGGGGTCDSVSPCLGTTRCEIVATDKIRM